MPSRHASFAALPIETFIPHRGAMRWVDRLVACDCTSAVVEADLPWRGAHVQQGQIGSWLGIEYMAQAVAAWSGWRAWSAGRTPRIGMLLGTRRYAATRGTFPAGAVLRIDVHDELVGGGEFGLFDCRINLAGAVVATAVLSVFEPSHDLREADGLDSDSDSDSDSHGHSHVLDPDHDRDSATDRRDLVHRATEAALPSGHHHGPMP